MNNAKNSLKRFFLQYLPEGLSASCTHSSRRAGIYYYNESESVNDFFPQPMALVYDHKPIASVTILLNSITAVSHSFFDLIPGQPSRNEIKRVVSQLIDGLNHQFYSSHYQCVVVHLNSQRSSLNQDFIAEIEAEFQQKITKYRPRIFRFSYEESEDGSISYYATTLFNQSIDNLTFKIADFRHSTLSLYRKNLVDFGLTNLEIVQLYQDLIEYWHIKRTLTRLSERKVSFINTRSNDRFRRAIKPDKHFIVIQ